MTDTNDNDTTDLNPDAPTHERLDAIEAEVQKLGTWLADLDARHYDLDARVETHHTPGDDSDTDDAVTVDDRLDMLERRTERLDESRADHAERMNDLQRAIETFHDAADRRLADDPHACPACGATARAEPLALDGTFNTGETMLNALVITATDGVAIGLHVTCETDDCDWTHDAILPFPEVSTDD